MGIPGSADPMLFGGAAGDEIEQSLRFNSADSAYLNRTPGSAGNRKTWTWSGWVKRGNLGANQDIFTCNANAEFYFRSNDKIKFYDFASGSTEIETSQVFRDVGAWYHIVLALDTTQATASNRFKLYVNGEQITGFGDETYPALNEDLNWNNNISHSLGRRDSANSQFLDGYLAEVNFIDGSALDPTDFGEFDDNGVWRPIKYAGSYTGNSFYLKFASGDGTDSSGLSNTWTANNFTTSGTGTDVMSDTPTTNYATINPLSKEANITLTNGNLDGDSNGSTATAAYTTFAVSSGKWYTEVTFTNTPAFAGIIQSNYVGGDLRYPGRDVSGSTSIGIRGSNGAKYKDGTATSYGSAFSANDVCGIALDMDNGKIWFSKNGTFFASGDPAAGTNAAYTTDILGKEFCFAAGDNASASRTWTLNAGQRAFAYTPPTGFNALNTKNLPAPDIADGSQYFNTVLYTGNATVRSITGVGFQPDLVWIKDRSGAYNHGLFDAVRGANLRLSSSTSGAEITYTQSLTAFDSDGFSLGDNSDSNNTVNINNNTYVAWNWDAGGSGSSNTAGSITSTVSANPSAGFSIVTYTGTGSNATVGHGLGVAPKMIMVKNRDAAAYWNVYHAGVDASSPEDYFLRLDTTDARIDSSLKWNDTAPTSSVFSVGTSGNVNSNTNDIIAYCFAEVEGYSKFGSYTGNGSTDGPFLSLGFKPAWLMYKITNTTGNWIIHDTTRSEYNVTTNRLFANLANTENTSTTVSWDLLSNGAKIRTSDAGVNGSGNTFIFAAFAENPFGGSGISPATAR